MSVNINASPANQVYSQYKDVRKDRDQCLSEYRIRQSFSNDFLGISAQMGRSGYENQEEQLAKLAEMIEKFEKDIKQKEKFYSQTAYDIQCRLRARNQDNKILKAEIYQLKDEARRLKKQTQEFSRKGNEKLQKCYSARDLFMSTKMEAQQNMRSTMNTKSKLQSKKSMFQIK